MFDIKMKHDLFYIYCEGNITVLFTCTNSYMRIRKKYLIFILTIYSFGTYMGNSMTRGIHQCGYLKTELKLVLIKDYGLQFQPC